MMGEWIGLGGLVGSGLAVWALLWIRKLTKDLQGIKRNEYYASQKLDRFSSQLVEALESLRLQLAAVASGRPVSNELIRQGRLYHDVSAEEAARMIAHEQATKPDQIMIVDVRTAKEYAMRHVPGAALIPVEELDKRCWSEIPLTIEKVFVYCQAGDRSRLACDYLSRQGYMNLYNIRDGLNRWPGETIGQAAMPLISIESKSRRQSDDGS
ncbi:MAG: rhodanese-like domain-containing protein [Nitrospirae bacterium]|nr:MAG: rhodanese-like domain-containing protein [Nitrospirota bacterium]